MDVTIIEMKLRNIFPYSINKRLFGDRERFGLMIEEKDKDWVEWMNFYEEFYHNTQKKGVGDYINELGYRVLGDIDFDQKTILEVGPGSLPHMKFWKGKPKKYFIADVNNFFLSQSLEKIPDIGEPLLLKRENKIDLEDNSIDILITFYCLEHILDLKNQLLDYRRIIKPGGLLVGGIPNEGHFMWGLGRYLTSRRFVHKNSSINYDKIICWEHPNYADTVLDNIIDTGFVEVKKNSLPLGRFTPMDLNLITSFIYKNI